MAAPVALLIASGAGAQPTDPDTRAWWDITTALSNDGMEGRDTGSPGHERAAKLVAARFERAGLKPLGEQGSWFQQVPLEEVAIDKVVATVGQRPLRFLHQFFLSPVAGMPTSIDAPLAFGGYCGADAIAGIAGGVQGRLVLCHGIRRANFPTPAEREAAVKAAGGIGILTIADPGFKVEPPRWPFAYSRSITITGKKAEYDGFLRLTLNADALGQVIGNAPHDAADLIAKGSAGATLPSFPLSDRLKASLTIRQGTLVSANVLGILPGSDPGLADQAIVLSAHLDGYGRGEPVNGDGLYNGTLDDAAYVALLIQQADRLRGKGYRRPIIFVAFTGEEKGLLGAHYFVDHPTLPKAHIAANINLDQLRPIFPLELLTVHGLDDSSLGEDARTVANSMGVAVQHDPEPERNLLRRADQWPFLEAGIPATAFVFGYHPGTESERIYRQWYKTGYHKPQDDPNQLIDWKAAADFNRFFYTLVQKVADQDAPPSWRPDSRLKPAAH